MASLFEAAQAGDVAAIRSALDAGSVNEQQPVDVNAKDEQGNSALVLAAKAGHQEAVGELLARGADRHEALAQGLGQDDSPVAALLNEQQFQASEASHPHQHQHQHHQHQQQHMYAPVPTDMYGGYQLPDGSIAYGGYPQYPPPFQGAPGHPSFYHDPGMFPHPNAAMPYGFPPAPQHRPHHAPPNGAFPGSHTRKPSAVGKYPPPEVAKTIPCRFYPNCRNGASCIFAHIDMPQPADGQGVEGGSPAPAAAAAATQQQAAASPSAYHSPPPPGYFAAPGAYGAGPQFFPMHAMPYGGPQGPMPLHYQPHEASQPGQMTPAAPQSHASPAAPAAASQSQQQQHDESTAGKAEEQTAAPEASPSPSGSKDADAAAQTTSTSMSSAAASAPVFQPAAAPASAEQSVPAGSEPVVAPTTSDGKAAIDRRRRQSFNSFLHSHAVPFQPSELPAVPLGPAAAMNGHLHGAGHGHHMFGLGGRGKPRGRGGHAGMLGRGSRERGPCTFFAKNACKYGSECLFPHVLPDGTDARRLPNVNAHSAAAAAAAIAGSSANHAASDANVGSADAAMTGASSAADSPSVNTAAETSASSVATDSQQQQVNGFVPSKPSATLMAQNAAAAASAAVASTETEAPSGSAAPSAPATAAAQSSAAKSSQSQGQQQQQQQQQPPPQHPRNQQQQGPSASSSRKQQSGRNAASSQGTGPATTKKAPLQRVPNGADFPALPGSPSGAATQSSSPALGSSPLVNGHSEAASTTPAASTAAAGPPAKVNFSAILSAPAPPKKAAEVATPSPAKVAEEGPAPGGPDGDKKAEEDDAATQADAKPATDEGAASQTSANGPPASAWGKPLINGHSQGQGQGQAAAAPAPAVNGVPKDKPAASSSASKGSRSSKQNGSSSGGNNTKSWATKQPASKEPVVDADDFQLVKSRNHGKKGQHQGGRSAASNSGSANGGSGGNFANVAKAAVAA